MTIYLITTLFIAGIALSQYLSASPLWLVAALFSFFFAILTRIAPAIRYLRLPLFSCAILFSALTFTHLAMQPEGGEEITAFYNAGNPVELTAKIINRQIKDEGRSRVDLALETIDRIAVTGRVRLTIATSTTPLYPGDRVRFLTWLRLPRDFATPGEFSYTRYLAAHGIAATCFVKSDTALTLLSRAGALHTAMAHWRQEIRQQINNGLPETAASLTCALIVGDGASIPRQTRQILSRSGISHLFSISGFHFALVAAFFYLFLRQMYRHIPGISRLIPIYLFSAVFLAPALWVYLQFTGSGLPAVRSFILLVAITALALCRYRTSAPALLAAILLGILLVNPLWLFSASLQLSFAGVAGLILAQPLLKKFRGLPTLIRFTATTVTATAAATLATAPFVVLHFHQLAPAGLFANLFAVPVISLIALPTGITAVFVHLFSAEWSQWLFQLCAAFLQTTICHLRLIWR